MSHTFHHNGDTSSKATRNARNAARAARLIDRRFDMFNLLERDDILRDATRYARKAACDVWRDQTGVFDPVALATCCAAVAALFTTLSCNALSSWRVQRRSERRLRVGIARLRAARARAFIGARRAR